MMSALKKTTRNWIANSDYAIKTAQHLLATGRYLYVIFMCHLAVEKLLKAAVAQIQEKHPLYTHDLQRLIQLADLQVPQKLKPFIAELNQLSIVTRYPEDLQKMVKQYPKSVTEGFLRQSQGFLRWLKHDPRLKKS